MFLIILHEEKENLILSAETTASRCRGLFDLTSKFSHGLRSIFQGIFCIALDI